VGNLGMPELILILVLALLIFGPRKLPEVGKQVGKALGEFRRASNDLKRTIEDEMDRADRDEKRAAEPEPAPVAAVPPEGTVAASAAVTPASNAVTPS